MYSPYESPEAEVLVIRFEESILSNGEGTEVPDPDPDGDLNL